jgi:hypothetical protein
MKKLFLAITLAIFIFCGSAYAGEDCVSSGIKTGNAVIVPGPVIFCGVLVTTDGTNTATVAIYDSATAATTSGTEIVPPIIVPGSSYWFGGFTYSPARNGIYATISGTGASYVIYYRSK